MSLTGCAPPATGQGPAIPAARDDFEAPRVYEVPLESSGDADENQSGFIEVQGSAELSIPADLARVTFAVETRAVTAADAAAENADLMDAVLRSLRAGGFTRLRLETFGYALRPEYSFGEDRTRTIEGYTAVNNVQATISDVEAVGGVIDAAIAAGANRIGSISFDTEDTSEARSQALAEAVTAAREEARTIARSLGHELGPALEVRGGAERPSPRPMDMGAMAMRAEGAPTPIEAGEHTVRASVTVRFALGPELPER